MGLDGLWHEIDAVEVEFIGVEVGRCMTPQRLDYLEGVIERAPAGLIVHACRLVLLTLPTDTDPDVEAAA
jgi:hypothetical protein